MKSVKSAICENANRILKAMKFLGERISMAQGPAKRSALLLDMTRCEETLKRLATGKDPDPEVINVWREAVALQKEIRASVTANTDPITLDPLRTAAAAVTRIFGKLRMLETALREDPKAGSYQDLVEVGGLIAVAGNLATIAAAELSPDSATANPLAIEIFTLCSEISQGANACLDLGAKLSAVLASRLP